MNIKKVILGIIIILLVGSGVVFYVFQDRSKAEIDIVAVNDIAQSLAEEWNSVKDNKLPGLNYELEYVVLDSDNNYVASTKRDLNTDINSAIRNRDTIIEIKSDNKEIGKLIIYNNIDDIWNQYRMYLFAFTEIFILAVGVLGIVYTLYIDRIIFLPFRRLTDFARQVAEGNLDIPLEMDKGNLFGAFTESFDLMREELKKARENERIANQSKKELVASLSHDIKTPVASIMAVAEVMHAKSKDVYEKKQLDVINSKAEQINTLITNMFNATLEELQELKVSVTEQSSRLIYDLIKNADYNNHVTCFSISECIVLLDELRLAQVIDNVISNSYKYACTSIDISTYIKENYLFIDFKDFGSGVLEDEKPLIFNKFYRAKNSEGKNGTGLGLYISKYLMNQMSGDIECENVDDGFIVRIKLLIA